MVIKPWSLPLTTGPSSTEKSRLDLTSRKITSVDDSIEVPAFKWSGRGVVGDAKEQGTMCLQYSHT